MPTYCLTSVCLFVVVWGGCCCLMAKWWQPLLSLLIGDDDGWKCGKVESCCWRLSVIFSWAMSVKSFFLFLTYQQLFTFCHFSCVHVVYFKMFIPVDGKNIMHGAVRRKCYIISIWKCEMWTVDRKWHLAWSVKQPLKPRYGWRC